MIDAPRGRYIGKLVGARPKDEAEHFLKCRPAAAGLIAGIWARSLRTKGRCRIRSGIVAMTTKKPRYESRVFDGVP
jgi:hypothetical protein